MVRIHYVKYGRARIREKCRKCGEKIKVGEPYYYFTNRIGRSFYCGKHHPRPSDVTTSDKLSTLYRAREDFSDTISDTSTLGEMVEALRGTANIASDVKDEYQNSLDNMPESLQESSGIQEKIDSCEEWESTLNDAADEIEGMICDEESKEESKDKAKPEPSTSKPEPPKEGPKPAEPKDKPWIDDTKGFTNETNEQAYQLAEDAISSLSL
jgi:hypothetical protein